jgi:hypothetical protein
VREIQDKIYQQLVLTAHSWWILSSAALAGSALISPEPRVGPSSGGQAASSQSGALVGRVLSLAGVPSGSVISLEEVRPAGSAPGDRARIVGTVVYTPPASGNGGNGGGRISPGTERGRGPTLPVPLTATE